MKTVSIKHVVLTICMLFTASLFSSFKKSESIKPFFLKKEVNASITSTGGCTFSIHGYVTYSLFPPSISGFTGTVTLSGTCSGTYTFARGDYNTETDGEGNIRSGIWDIHSSEDISSAESDLSNSEFETPFNQLLQEVCSTP